jgi:hypothetical protein
VGVELVVELSVFAVGEFGFGIAPLVRSFVVFAVFFLR